MAWPSALATPKQAWLATAADAPQIAAAPARCHGSSRCPIAGGLSDIGRRAAPSESRPHPVGLLPTRRWGEQAREGRRLHPLPRKMELELLSFR